MRPRIICACLALLGAALLRTVSGSDFAATASPGDSHAILRELVRAGLSLSRLFDSAIAVGAIVLICAAVLTCLLALRSAAHPDACIEA